MRLPQLDIRTIPAKVDIKTEQAVLTIHQQRGEVQVRTEGPKMDVESHRPVLNVDQSATWDALNGGRPEGFIKRLHSQATSYVQEHIMATNAKWRQIGDIAHTKNNPIPDMAYEEITRHPSPLPVYGPASRFNTVINVSVQKPDIEVTPGKVNIDVIDTHQKPDIQYTPGKVHFTMEQYPKVVVTPPPIVDLMA